MSHIVTSKSEIKNLSYVVSACERLGLAYETNAMPRYYGSMYGGRESRDCDLVIKLPGKYDLGIQADGKGGYSFVCDNELLSGSFGLHDAGRQLLGDNAGLLMLTYNEVKTEDALMMAGISFTKSVDETGATVYEAADPIALGLVQG
jgi:hypothetical protein